MEFVYQVRYTVLDCDAMVEYIRRNFAIEPDDRRTTDHPRVKEALYLIDDGSLTIQITELQEPEWDIVRHLTEQGPGVYHTEFRTLKLIPVEEFEDEDDESDEFGGFASRLGAAFLAERDRIRQAGSVAGVHHTEYVEQVKQLKIAKRHDEAIALLLNLIAAVEAESEAAGNDYGVSPWYYEQLAIIYRKEKRYADEVAILERYAAQPKAGGAAPAKLATRLIRAKTLAAK